MTQYPFTGPQLPFPYNYVLDLIQSTEVYTVDEDRTIPEGCASLFVVPLTPAQLREFTSALQAGADLIYPERWQEVMDYWVWPSQYPNNLIWWQDEIQGVCTVGLCDLVRDCIETNPGVIEAIREIVREQGPSEVGESEDKDYQEFERVGDVDDNLDCVYGALTNAYDNILVPAWDTLKIAVDTATDLAGIIKDLPFVGVVSSQYFNGLETLLSAGTSAYDAHMVNIATRDRVICAIFDAICNRGEPYRIRNEDISAGIDALGTSQPVPFINELVGQVLNRQTFAAYWKRRTDDTCSNDWQLICSCDPAVWTYIIDAPNFTAEGTVVSGIFSSSEQAYRPPFDNDPPTGTTFAEFEVNFTPGASTVITGAEMEAVRGSSYSNRSQVQLGGTADLFDIPIGTRGWAGPTDLSITGASKINFLAGQPRRTSPSFGAYLYRVRISGTGDNPFAP